MITEDYVSFEVAKLLKEKGFDEICRAFWKVWDNHTTICDCSSSHLFEYCHNSMLEQYNDDEELNIACPTLQMAMRWLRENHNIDIMICVVDHSTITMEQDYYFYKIMLNRRHKHNESPFYHTYEETAESAIKYCLENLI